MIIMDDGGHVSDFDYDNNANNDDSIWFMWQGGNMTRVEEGLSSCFVTAERATVGAQGASSHQPHHYHHQQHHQHL